MSRRLTLRMVARSSAASPARSASEANSAADSDDLSGDVVGLGDAEEIDSIRRLLDGAQSAERDLLLLERVEQRGLNAIFDGASAHVDCGRRGVAERLRHACLNETERDA